MGVQAGRRRLVAKTIRLRDKLYCKSVAQQTCAVNGRTPSEARKSVLRNWERSS